MSEKSPLLPGEQILPALLPTSALAIPTELAPMVPALIAAAGWHIRMHEKGGKHHTIPCHRALAEALRAYIEAAGIAKDRKGVLFRSSRGHAGMTLSEQPMTQPDAWRMIRRRAAAAGIMTPILFTCSARAIDKPIHSIRELRALLM